MIEGLDVVGFSVGDVDGKELVGLPVGLIVGGT